jgi:osmoprotectant transport system ATP-binding protein
MARRVRYASPMFVLENVRRGFDGETLFDGLDLVIEPGQTTVLIGPSGCGKSTLLRLMLGLLTAEAGRIMFEGAVLSPDTVLEARRRMGYVIQGGGLFPHLTARDNITLMARQLGRSAADIEARVGELADLTRFPLDALDRFPLQISGGQRQRVALMRALMLDPDVLLLDEPLGALDPMVRYQLQTDLREIFRVLGKTVVLVTHDLAEAGFFADRIVLLRDGHIVQSGSIDDLIARPADPFVEAFVTAQRTLHDVREAAS